MRCTKRWAQPPAVAPLPPPPDPLPTRPMDTRLIDLLVCPICKSPLSHDREARELICAADRLAFPIRDGIPVMLVNEARAVDEAAPPAAAGLSA